MFILSDIGGDFVKKRTLIITMLLIFMLCINSYGGTVFKPDGDKEINGMRVQLNGNASSFDSALSANTYELSLVNNMFEGLYRVKDEQVVPGMAERHEISDDGLIYTFHLRDAKWSDGESVTAHDFEYAWKRALDPSLDNHFKFQLYLVKNGRAYSEGNATIDQVGVRAINEKTLQVTLEQVAPYFAELTAFQTFGPIREDIVTLNPEQWSTDPDVFVSNGPFKLAFDSLPRSFIVKNETYWNANDIKLDYIDIIKAVDPRIAFTAFKENSLHIIESVPDEIIQSRHAKEQMVGGTYHHVFNTQHSILKDPKVRQALTLSIDRKTLLENVGYIGNNVANHFIAPGYKLSTGQDVVEVSNANGVNYARLDIELARALLSEAGYPNGEGLPTLKLLHSDYDYDVKFSKIVAEMWKENLNVNVELISTDWTSVYETSNEGAFEIATGGWFADYNDPLTFLERWSSSHEFNGAQWTNTEYDLFIEKIKTFTGLERDQYIIKASNKLMNDAIVSPIFYYSRNYMIKDNVYGSHFSQNGIWYFGDVDIIK